MSARNYKTINYRRVQKRLYYNNTSNPGQPPLPPEPPTPRPPPPLSPPPHLAAEGEVEVFKELVIPLESKFRNILHIKDRRRGRDDPTIETVMITRTQNLVNYVKHGDVQLWHIHEICDYLLSRLTQTKPFAPVARVLHWVLIYIAQHAYETYKTEEFAPTVLGILKKVDKVFLHTARFLKTEQELYLIEELVAMLSRLPLSKINFLSPEVPRILRKGREFLWPLICDKSSEDHTYFLGGLEKAKRANEYVQFRRVWNLIRGWKGGGVLSQKRQEYYNDIRLGAKLLVARLILGKNLTIFDHMTQFLEPPDEPLFPSGDHLHPLDNSKWRERHSQSFKPTEWATYYIVLLWTVSRVMVQVQSHSQADCLFALKRLIKLLDLGVKAIQKCGANGREIWKIALDIFGTSRSPNNCNCKEICDRIKAAFPYDYPASLQDQRELRHIDIEQFFFPRQKQKQRVEPPIPHRHGDFFSYSSTPSPLKTDFRSASEKAAEEAKKFAAGFQHLAQLALMEGQEGHYGEMEAAEEPDIVEVTVKRRKGKEKKRYLATVDTGGKKKVMVQENEKQSANSKKDDIMVMPPLPPLTLTEILQSGKSKKMQRESEEGIRAGTGNANAANNDDDTQGEDFSDNFWPVFCPSVNSSENGNDHGRIHSKSRKGNKYKNKGNHSLPLEEATEEDYVIVAMKNPFCISDFVDLEVLSKKQGLRKDYKVVYFLPKSKESSKWFRRYRRKWRRGGCRCDVYKECDSLLSSESYQALLKGEHSPAIDDTNPME